MEHNRWIHDFLRDEIETIVLSLNRRNVDEVTAMLVGRITEKHLTIVPTFLSDEMYDAQRKVDNKLSYQEASKLYSSALDDFAKRKSHREHSEKIEGGFW
jgi:hypothetical protein